MTWMARAGGGRDGSQQPLLLQKISLSRFQRTRKHFSSGSGNGFGNGFLPFFRLSDGRTDGRDDDAVWRMQMENSDSPLLKTRNEIQLTNCFLAAAAAPSMSRHVRRRQRTKFAFGAACNSV